MEKVPLGQTVVRLNQNRTETAHTRQPPPEMEHTFWSVTLPSTGLNSLFQELDTQKEYMSHNEEGKCWLKICSNP